MKEETSNTGSEEKQVDTSSNQMNVPAKPAMTKKMLKRQKTYQQAMQKQFANYQRTAVRMNRLQRNQLEVLKHQIGKEDYNALKSICTTVVEEKKNDKGEVIQNAESNLNKMALIVETRNLLALKREDRIARGLRSRGSGRASKRRSHTSLVSMLKRRNEQAVKEA